jgi:hypothetical protein
MAVVGAVSTTAESRLRRWRPVLLCAIGLWNMLQPIHALARADSMLMHVWQAMSLLRDTVQELLPMLLVRTVIPRVSR